MIDYDLNNEFSDFIKDTNDLFYQYNQCSPAGFEVKSEDRALMVIMFFLSKICDSLVNIENAMLQMDIT